MAHILICYFSADTPGVTARIYDQLNAHFGSEAVQIFEGPAADGGFDQRQLAEIQAHCRAATLVLAIVGQHWLECLKDESNPARILLQEALDTRTEIIPILVNHACMPQPAELPDGLGDLAFLNAAAVDPGRDFPVHMDRVKRTIEGVLSLDRPSRSMANRLFGLLGREPKQRPQPEPPRGPESARIFISHASQDRKIAETICRALESRHLPCWISSRDIGGGENFQDAIVRAIRVAKVMVLIFTANANNSAEIKKEIALAGRHKLTVIPVRVEDVAPNDALDYEFATRQWIDMFDNWEHAIDNLGSRIEAVLKSD